MAEIAITVDCRFSGQTADFDYVDDGTLAQLILDLQDQGMAWSDSPHGHGISIDGAAGHDYQNNHSSTLADLGVSDGSVITIIKEIHGSPGGPGFPEGVLEAHAAWKDKTAKWTDFVKASGGVHKANEYREIIDGT